MTDIVYVVEYEGTGIAKIGYTTNFPRRLQQLQRWMAASGKQPTLQLLITFEGGPELEQALHHHFRHRVRHGDEGFDAAWVKASLPHLDTQAVLQAYSERGQWDEVTEVLPPGYRPTHPTEDELAQMLEGNEVWREEVARLRFPIGFNRHKSMHKRPLVDAEVQHLLDTLSVRDQAFIWCSLGAGVRPNETVALTVRDLSQEGSLSVNGHTCYLSRQGFAVLSAHRDTLEDNGPHAPLFPSRKGGSCLLDTAGIKIVATRLREAGIQADPASLRTTHMVGLYQQGTSLEVIARQMRYDSVAKMRPVLAEALL